MPEFKIGTSTIGPGQPCFIIAEAGVNHNGSLETALKLVETAARAGANAVKFQTFHSERVVVRTAPKAAYQKAATGAMESQYEMIQRLELSDEAYIKISACAKANHIEFLSTPFDFESADFLEKIGVPAFKLPSGEVTNLPFLEHVGRKGRPIILSTGMSSLGEVEDALAALSASGNRAVALLQCVSNYPAAPDDSNLRCMQTLEQAFNVPVGYSDHTLGNEVAFAAVALGACIIEKHFTLDRSLPGPDQQASATPDELRMLIEGIRKVEAALGDGRKTRRPSEEDTAAVARRSIVLNRDLPAGTLLSRDVLAILRPGTGLPPRLLPLVLGRKLRVDVKAGALLELGMLV